MGEKGPGVIITHWIIGSMWKMGKMEMEQSLLDQVKRSSISFRGKSPYWYFMKKRHVIPSGTWVSAGLQVDQVR